MDFLLNSFLNAQFTFGFCTFKPTKIELFITLLLIIHLR